MTLTPRAAAIRGDDYQHAIGWFWACEMLRDPDIETVTIEDPAGGLVPRTDPPHYAAFFRVRGGRGFAEIVGQHGKHQQPPLPCVARFPVVEGDDSIETVLGVREHVAFRMPLRVL